MLRFDWFRAFLLCCLSGLCGCSSNSAPTGPSLGSQVDAALKDPNPITRAHNLTKLGYQQYKARDIGAADKTMEAATAACKEIKDPSSRANECTWLGDAQARAGSKVESRKALAEARKAIDQNDKAEIKPGQLAAIAEVEAVQLQDEAAGRKTLEAAHEAAGKITDAEGKVPALIMVANSYSAMKAQSEAAKLLAEASEAAGTVAEARKRSDLVASIAVAETKCSPETAPATFDAAIEAARQVESDYSKSFALADIAGKMIEAREAAKARAVLDEADAAAKKIKEPDLQKEALGKIDKARAGLPAA
jgi:hypothetical protein